MKNKPQQRAYDTKFSKMNLNPSPAQIKEMFHIEALIFSEQGILLRDACLERLLENKKLLKQTKEISYKIFKMMDGNVNVTMFYALYMAMANVVKTTESWVKVMENDKNGRHLGMEVA